MKPIDLIIILAFLSLVIIDPYSILLLIGIVFVFSKSLRTKIYISKISYWICLNIFKPRTEYNHIIWGLFITFFGIIHKINSYYYKSGNYPDQFNINQILYSYQFWILMIMVLIFNVLVGLYTIRRYQNKKNKNEKEEL